MGKKGPAGARGSDEGRQPYRVRDLPRAHTQFEGYANPIALSGIEMAPITILCAEPGCGKNEIVNRVLGEARRNGIEAKFLAFDDLSDEDSYEQVVRRCREAMHQLRSCSQSIVVLHGVAPGDERQVELEAAALRRLSSAVSVVLLCIRPEAEQLAEELHEACVLRAPDLVYGRGDVDDDDWGLTGGVPLLVSALAGDRASGNTSSIGGPRYAASLERLVRSTLRAGMPCEDLRVRLAMVLLGAGTLEEVDAVSGRCDAEAFAWLGRDVPFLGVMVESKTFCCHGVTSDRLLSCCLGALHHLAAQEQKVVLRACGALAARGDMARAVTVSKLCSSEQDFALIGCRWGVDLVAIGEVRVVEEALRTSRRLGMPDDARRLLSEMALAEAMEPAADVDQIRGRLDGLRVCGWGEARAFERVRLFGACRDLWRDPRRCRADLTAHPTDALGVAALEHVRLGQMMLCGRFSETYARLANNLVFQRVESVPEALLTCDLLVSLVMAGGCPDERERRIAARADALFRRMHRCPLLTYATAVRQALGILMGEQRASGLVEHAAMRAERSGDQLLEAVFLCVAAVCDLKNHALSRAHVRAGRASMVLRGLDAEYLASAAELVDSVICERLGEVGALARYDSRPGRPEELALLGAVAARAAGEVSGSAGDAPLVPLGTPCPRDSLWALRMLLNDCGTLSAAVARELPGAWEEQLRATMGRLAPVLGGGSPSVGEGVLRTNEPSEPREVVTGTQMRLIEQESASTPVRIALLGGLRVIAEGDLVPDGAFGRRSARELLMLLALVPGHRLPRYQAIEAIWPSVDFYRGPRKVYEATGEIRRCLHGAGVGGDPIASDRAQGTVGFDEAIVSFDIDDFEHEARLTLDEERDDFWVLDHARQMTRLYGSGVDARATSLGGEVPVRIRELESTFVDGLVAASEAALRVGKARLAVKYATTAHRMADLREDAVVALVNALKVAGRAFEIRDLYQRFARRLMRVQGTTPSLSLRHAVRRAIGEDPGVPMEDL